MADMFKMQADIRAWENIDRYYDSLELVQDEDPEAGEYTVKATNSHGRDHLYYFSKESGLMVGSKMTMDTPMGEVTQNTAMKEYQDFGGVLWPKEMEQSSAMANVRIVIDSVSYESLSENDFMRPE